MANDRWEYSGHINEGGESKADQRKTVIGCYIETRVLRPAKVGQKARKDENDVSGELEKLFNIVRKILAAVLAILRRQMIQGQIPGYFNDDRLNVNALSQNKAVQSVHGLREDGILIHRIPRNHWSQDPLERLENLQPLGRRNGLVNKSFKRQTIEDEKEGNRLITVVDVMSPTVVVAIDKAISLFLCLPMFWLVEFAVKCVKDKITVLFNKASNGVDEI